MSMRDFMNRRKETKAADSAKPPTEKKPKKVEEARPEAMIVYGCGCKVRAGHLQRNCCPMCHRKNFRAKRHRYQTKKDSADGRLPDGAQFDVTYDAERTTWTGTLTVAGMKFTGQAGAVFFLLSQLDAKYREFAAQESTCQEKGE